MNISNITPGSEYWSTAIPAAIISASSVISREVMVEIWIRDKEGSDMETIFSFPVFLRDESASVEMSDIITVYMADSGLIRAQFGLYIHFTGEDDLPENRRNCIFDVMYCRRHPGISPSRFREKNFLTVAPVLFLSPGETVNIYLLPDDSDQEIELTEEYIDDSGNLKSGYTVQKHRFPSLFSIETPQIRLQQLQSVGVTFHVSRPVCTTVRVGKRVMRIYPADGSTLEFLNRFSIPEKAIFAAEHKEKLTHAGNYGIISGVPRNYGEKLEQEFTTLLPPTQPDVARWMSEIQDSPLKRIKFDVGAGVMSGDIAITSAEWDISEESSEMPEPKFVWRFVSRTPVYPVSSSVDTYDRIFTEQFTEQFS